MLLLTLFQGYDPKLQEALSAPGPGLQLTFPGPTDDILSCYHRAQGLAASCLSAPGFLQSILYAIDDLSSHPASLKLK